MLRCPDTSGLRAFCLTCVLCGAYDVVASAGGMLYFLFLSAATFLGVASAVGVERTLLFRRVFSRLLPVLLNTLWKRANYAQSAGLTLRFCFLLKTECKLCNPMLFLYGIGEHHASRIGRSENNTTWHVAGGWWWLLWLGLRRAGIHVCETIFGDEGGSLRAWLRSTPYFLQQDT